MRIRKVDKGWREKKTTFKSRSRWDLDNIVMKSLKQRDIAGLDPGILAGFCFYTFPKVMPFLVQCSDLKKK
jgi:hypothetical protein